MANNNGEVRSRWCRTASPVDQLVLSCPIVGLVLGLERFSAGRRPDRFPRGLPIRGGVACGSAALVVASAADSVAVLPLAGCLFGIGVLATSLTHMVIVMDRADLRTRGASMATYSLGYQPGYGLGAALWSVVISVAGFPARFVVGLVAMALMAGLVLSAREELLASRFAA